MQSTTLALMAAVGEIRPMPEVAIFADTGWEPQNVYRHLWWLVEQLPFPVIIASRSNIREDQIRNAETGARVAAIPYFLEGAGMGRRQCTKEYKIDPIRRAIRSYLGYGRTQRIPPNSVEMWIGISLDEASRAKPSQVQYIKHRWPLLDLRMRRSDCLRWINDHGYHEPPKSSCIGCPFHSNSYWKAMRDKNPEEWAQAVEIDRKIRTGGRMKHKQYLHRSCKPLDEADLEPEKNQLNMFENECEGMCGV